MRPDLRKTRSMCLSPARAATAALGFLLLAACFPLEIENGEESREGEGEPLLVLGGWIHDGRGGPPIENGAILVHGDRIASVGKKSEVELPAVARVVLAEKDTVIPGLVDAHGRIFCEEGTARELLADLERAPKLGITTIVDEAGPEPLARAVSEWMGDREAGWPRLIPRLAKRDGDPCSASPPPGPAEVLPAAVADRAVEKAVAGVTWEPAREAGLESTVGSIEPGKLADLVVVEGRLGAGSPDGGFRVKETIVGGVLVEHAAALPSDGEVSSLGWKLLFTKLAKPSLWWR